MLTQATIDIDTLLDERKLGKFRFMTAFLCFLVVIVDGLDFGAGNVAAPAILRAFNAEKSAMGIVFGAGYLGILVGSIVFGYIGDRYGRRVGAIYGVLAYSIPALMQGFAGSLDTIMIWRFIAGLGIGGVMPNVIAMISETVPKKYRASAVVYTIHGYSVGTLLIAQVAAHFIPTMGWPVVFFVAGGTGLVLSLVLFAFLPESIRFLNISAPNSPELRRLVGRIAPELRPQLETATFRRQVVVKKDFTLAMLFQGDQRVATPLLWIVYFFESLTYMTLLSWMPVILESTGLSPSGAALTYSYAALCGIITAFVLARLLDLIGPLTTMGTAIGAVAAVLYLGAPGLPERMIIIAAIATMALCATTHNALNSTVGTFYPTNIRSNGIGFASSMGRVAAILGPMIAGYLMSQKLPLQTMLYVVAGPYLVVILGALPLGLLYRKRLRASSAPIASIEAPLPTTNVSESLGASSS